MPSTEPLRFDPARLGVAPHEVGVVLVDHGSRRAESNALPARIARWLAAETGFALIEPAHMELAEPSLATAFDRCVGRGARVVLVAPFFLAEGRHIHDDIPRLAAAAAARHPGVRYAIAGPLGEHPLLAKILADRLGELPAFEG